MKTVALVAIMVLAGSCSRETAGRRAASLHAVKRSQPGGRWTNGLDMVFVPVPGAAALVCVWETRVRDFEVFVTARGYDAGNETVVLRSDGWKRGTGFNWQNPGFTQGPTHPGVAVSWEDAHEFCDWLTDRERDLGHIGTEQGYRLPTKAEWSQQHLHRFPHRAGSG